jgi:hypothetical protein
MRRMQIRHLLILVLHVAIAIAVLIGVLRMTPVEDRPACPSCGRRALRQVPYSFCWCLECRSRYKSVRRDAREDAGKPEDDCFYQLWSFDGWLSRQIDRSARRVRPSDSPC